MSLQERTLVVRNFDPDKTTANLLKELCMQGGPVRKVVVRSDHAFVEYEDVDSVGYSKALLDGIKMFDRVLIFEPKLRLNIYSKYTKALNDYITYDKDIRREQHQRQQQRSQYRQQQQQQRQQQQQQQQYQQEYQYPIAQPQQTQVQYEPPFQAQYQQPYQLQYQTQMPPLMTPIPIQHQMQIPTQIPYQLPVPPQAPEPAPLLSFQLAQQYPPVIHYEPPQPYQPQNQFHQRRR